MSRFLVIPHSTDLIAVTTCFVGQNIARKQLEIAYDMHKKCLTTNLDLSLFCKFCLDLYKNVTFVMSIVHNFKFEKFKWFDITQLGFSVTKSFTVPFHTTNHISLLQSRFIYKYR